MTEAQKKLLLTIAKVLHDNEWFCKNFYDQLDYKEQENYRGYGQDPANSGYAIFNELISEVENDY